MLVSKNFPTYPLEHTPNPQPRIYEGMPESFGGWKGRGMSFLSGYDLGFFFLCLVFVQGILIWRCHHPILARVDGWMNLPEHIQSGQFIINPYPEWFGLFSLLVGPPPASLNGSAVFLFMGAPPQQRSAQGGTQYPGVANPILGSALNGSAISGRIPLPFTTFWGDYSTVWSL